MADETELPDSTFDADMVTVHLTGGYKAVLDGDPPWAFLTGLSKVTSNDPATAAEALDYLNKALPAMVSTWTLPAKIAGASVLPNGGDAPTTVAWQAGDIPPATREGLLSISTRLVVELALRYGQAFSALPKAPGGS